MLEDGDVISPSDEELLKELKTGQTFYLKYLGSVQVFESLTKKKPEVRDNWTRHCMYLICHQLGICNENLRPDEQLLDKLGEVKVEDKNVELNVALHAFIILDKDGIRILERHPIHVISYASSGTEESTKGVFCFVSHVRELGRRCLVFMEPDKNVDFIMETILQVFRLNNKGHGNKLSIKMARSSESSSNYDHQTSMNICNLPAALGLDRQPWYHGEMERATAESMLRNEGDFLVRISPNTANNFVLSGIANSVARHFLLLDENDQKVRKQQQVFETIVELIEYHRGENVPIISEGSELHLIRPIVRFTASLPLR
ncbi:SH2 domain containing protein [Brugia malayi]|uniref:BMA-SHC-1 n=1 Tax=Brugia malayi TaxID=6279 RepID=A0A0H5S3Y3_BRUMA|nr:SH2 domain containing protein [Brugia malayi]CRZ23308.1 BMA-SHC-1 [Brugia malayi]VIO97192.1 SH2 domain containing protein [Brugia malayi]